LILERYNSLIQSYVAFECIQLGANIINDVSCGRYDPKILKVAGRYNVPYICMHSRGTPKTMMKEEYIMYDGLIATIFKELDTTIQTIRTEGIPEY
jgi:dihydropteroate synthase